jgi:flavin reductase (DIM6/NTAB) family NADH-FMN oxidoreductase RutF
MGGLEMHVNSEPPILYFGTPVVLISILNEDGSCNLAPMSSAFSKTTQNMIRTDECVLNLPSVNEVAAVNRLALTTGSDPVPEFKLRKGYRHEADKFVIAGLTTMKWQPLMISFHQLYGLGPQLQDSAFGTIPETMSRSSDMEPARHPHG